VSIVKSSAALIMLLPFLATIQSVFPATSETLTSSPTLGEAGSVSVNVAPFM
jgi:hypothetical protein